MEHDRLGKYVISGILGKGAMGTVYDARDPVIDRRVAIKTLSLPDASDSEAQEELARFKREAQAAGRLTHPNIVGVFDYGETAEIAYIVMEFVDGPSLKSLLDKSERFPTAETVRILEGLLAGLQFSHERGVVHRDIKPANIMMTRDGQVKIADFGIARIESSSMTQAGTIMGTPAYMSPEQFMGQTVDPRTDIYSTGVVLYQMLTGERPFEGSMTAIMHKVLNVAPPRPSELSVTVPHALDGVVARAMAKRPEQRYASAAEFAQSLRAAAQGQTVPAGGIDTEATMVSSAQPVGVTAPVSAAAPPRVATANRNRLPVVAGVSLAMLAAAGGGWFFLAGEAQPPPSSQLSAVSPAPVPLPAQTTPLPPTAPVPLPAAPPVTSLPPPVVPPTAPLAPAVPPQAAPPPSVAVPPPAPVPAAPAVVPQTALAPVAPPQPPSSAQLRARLQAAFAAVSCALIDGSVADDGSVTVEGLAGRARDTELRRVVAELKAEAPLDWRVAAFDGPFCKSLDTLRPAARRFGSATPDVQLALKSGPFKLHENDNIVPRLVMPDYAGYVQLSYLTGDGTLVHLYPSNEARQLEVVTPDGRRQLFKLGPMEARQIPAGATVTIADPATCQCKPEEIGWQVAPPFGVDLMMVAVSSQPLFPARRPADDTADVYFRDLQATISDAARRGLRVSARATLVESTAR